MEEGEIDRISQLPEDVLIRILSLVPTKEVARAKLVSMAWKNLFEFLPSFTFDFLPRTFDLLPRTFDLLSPRSPPPEDIITDDMSSFINGIDSALKLHKHFTLDKLELCLVLDLIGSRSRSLIDSWIDAALERKVGHLDLWFLCRCPYLDVYLFPAKVFRARAITDLRLHGCGLEICGDINIDLPALRKLCLGGIGCDEQLIQKFISSCPLIQDLETSFCSGMQRIHVSGLANLQRLTVDKCYELESIQIDAPSLQYLKYYHEGSPCDIVFTSSEFLKELKLFDARYITEDFFQSLVYRFPNLERLKIFCHLRSIEISHHRLKRLDLTLNRKETMLKIDTPNLLSLSYRGYRMPLVSAIASMNTSSLREVDIKILNYYNNSVRHFSILQFKEFFKKMRHCRVMKLKLFIKSKQQLIVPGKLRPILSPPVYDIKHLRLAVGNCCRYQYIIDRMLWLCHPQTLSISRGTAPRFLKVLYSKFMNKEEHPKCCTSCTTKCWRHYLEEVQIDGGKSREEIDRIMEILDLSDTFMKCKVRFILKWRS